MWEDHPRACGEQGSASKILTELSGSSPRVRGAAREIRGTGIRLGIIPARAGSRYRARLESGTCKDHPRACGEQSTPPRYRPSRSGSSPRVRGAEFAKQHESVELGIIPARAGSSPRVTDTLNLSKDHPRACGEQRLTPQSSHRQNGSSPRVRGAADPQGARSRRSRIIPARAGSSTSAHARTRQWRGSSPRVRGAGTPEACTRRTVRIIPARAGSRTADGAGRFTGTDHPRACGEQSDRETCADCLHGSSPRVRGAACGRAVRGCRARIIPARAGSSRAERR